MWTNWLALNFSKILWRGTKRAVQIRMSANPNELTQCCKEKWRTTIPPLKNWSGQKEMASEKIGIFHAAFSLCLWFYLINNLMCVFGHLRLDWTVLEAGKKQISFLTSWCLKSKSCLFFFSWKDWMKPSCLRDSQPECLIHFTLLVPPTRTKCWVEGSEEKGGTVSLRCKSSHGTTPLTYAWTRETGGTIPTTATQSEQLNVNTSAHSPRRAVFSLFSPFLFRPRYWRASDKEPHRQ